eukprot:PhM_4_TR4360/c0_g1_i1/m.83184
MGNEQGKGAGGGGSEAMLTLGGDASKPAKPSGPPPPPGARGANLATPETAKKFSTVGYSLVGGGALDCVEAIGACPKPMCQAPGRKWGPCLPHGCDKAGVGFSLCRVTHKGKCTQCSA